MSEPNAGFPVFNAAGSGHLFVHHPPEPEPRAVAPEVTAAPEVPAAPEAEPDGADGFDRERVLRLLDRLERDIDAVELAMGHAESGEHDAYAAAVSSLSPRLAD
jgi:hypothetical protein